MSIKNLIIIHCSATPNGRALGGVVRGTYVPSVEVIDGWHRERGFRRDLASARRFNPRLLSVGYQFVIDVSGSVQSGRAVEERGAHTIGYNTAGIGVCMVGTDAFTLEQWLALNLCLRGDAGGGLARITGIPMKPPTRGPSGALGYGVCGHRDCSPDLNGDGKIERSEWTKTCPGFDVAAWLAADMQPLPEHVYKPAEAPHA